MATLVIAEHDNHSLAHSTLTTLFAATQLHSNVTVLVAGFQCNAVAQDIANYQGVTHVIYVDDSVYQYALAENLAQLVVHFSPNFTHILASATTFGKNLLPRVAGLLGQAQISDITQIIDANTFVRPIYAGNAVETVESLDPIKLMTVRPTAFTPVEKNSQTAAVVQEKIVFENQKVKFVERQFTQSERPELTSAKIVISGGRGLQNAENFKLLEQLANQLGAAMGASRAAVDAGFVPNDLQVGQTGKVVAPNLYIAVGISGAIQHLAGMKESKIIVAINKDADAPIFAIADYGLVGDLFKILPELSQELSNLGYRKLEEHT
jgi:electron transfer flavoprotein alpha subunit